MWVLLFQDTSYMLKVAGSGLRSCRLVGVQVFLLLYAVAVCRLGGLVAELMNLWIWATCGRLKVPGYRINGLRVMDENRLKARSWGLPVKRCGYSGGQCYDVLFGNKYKVIVNYPFSIARSG